MVVAVYAGTFDPIHNGHIEVVSTGAMLVDKLYWAIGVNPTKKPPMFELDERLDMMRECLDGPLRDVRAKIIVEAYPNLYLCDYAHEKGDAFIMRGLRNPEDARVELGFHELNKKWRPHIHTIFIPATKYGHVSSTLLKEMTGPTGWEPRVRELVPPCVFQRLSDRHGMPFLPADWRRAKH